MLDKSYLNKSPMGTNRLEPMKKPGALPKNSPDFAKKSTPFPTRQYTSPMKPPSSPLTSANKTPEDTSIFRGQSELSQWNVMVNLMKEMKKASPKERAKLGIPSKPTEWKKFAKDMVDSLPQDQWTNIVDKAEIARGMKILDKKRV